MRSMIGTCFGVFALLLARQTAHAEGYGGPDHLWMLWAGSHHPLGIAWEDPEWDGVRSSIQISFGLGMRPPVEMTLPLAVLGPLTVCVLAAVVYGLCNYFNKSKHHDQ